ncbi:hypothetical protein L6164_031105 [Bauhinia variegata]|uniref:Uncharacterized protein n=1 Tax=Bauhinia variegata TaxID=167791 RepID=A0ACB9LDZ5_BAUVA|nr:hypothetical protein L6164_031105 [Bauhinia variegata]
MIHLLLVLVLIEMILILTLSFANPLRKLLVKGLDQTKQGKGPLVTKTVAATMIVVFCSTIYSLTIIQQRSKDTGIVNPTDEVIAASRILEASLMGFSLFLGLMIDRLHYYINEITLLRKSLEIAKKLNQKSARPKNTGADETERAKAN